LEKEVHESLVPDLRQRLREYSQGLPWLFKKLAGHLIREVQQGVTQARLVAEALNVQNLFEADLAELQPVEQEALRHVARYAPISVTEVMDRTPAAIVQSLLDRRLIVQVGERLDTYWDIFRDFLNTGRIPIEDSYILRQTPRSVARLLEEVVSDEGDSYVPDVARRWHTSENAIYNLSREVRLLGVVAYEPNHVRLAPEVWGAPDPEEELRHRVGVALRRHRAYSFLVRLWERSPSFVSIGLFAKELPAAFPAVEVTTNTWTAYARAFAMWFSYAGLAVLRGQILTPPAGDEHSDSLLLSGGRMPPRTRGAFPHSPPGPSIKLLREIARSGGKWNFSAGRSTSRPLRELLILGAIWIARDGTVRIVDQALLDDEYQLKPEELLRLLKMVPGAEAALRVLEENPAAAPMTVGLALAKATGATWAPGTTHSAGKYFRSWARTAGVPVRRPSRESVKADSEEHEVEPEEHELEPEEDESSPQLSFEGWRTFPP
jgi:hypothetical protein